jgi:hypothetical protein
MGGRGSRKKLTLPPGGNSSGKGFGEARDWGGIFGGTSRFRAAEIALSRVSSGQAAESQRLFRTRQETGIAQDCVVELAGLEQAAERLWGGNVPVDGTTYDGHSHGIVWDSVVTVRSLDPAPAMIAARVCGGVNASGARSRMCLSTFPSRSVISANERTRPEARSSIQQRALAMARRMVSRVSGLSVGLRSG